MTQGTEYWTRTVGEQQADPLGDRPAGETKQLLVYVGLRER